MWYTIEDLIKIYADHKEITEKEAMERYQRGQIKKIQLLEVYLHNEGIHGYTIALYSIFAALGGQI